MTNLIIIRCTITFVKYFMNIVTNLLFFSYSTIFMCMCNGNKILHLFLYNPHILDGGWITQSVHKTRKGAESAMTQHKLEIIKEWEERTPTDDRHKYPFDDSQDWRICEFELLD